MISSNADVLGIVFPNSYDSLVPELVSDRLMASIPFAGRYRIIDFLLSSMANCGVDNISLIVRKNYHSLMDHLRNGREWDLTRKQGGLNLIPPFAKKAVRVYSGRVEALASILDFLRYQQEKYVIMADTNLVMNFNFKALMEAHIGRKADVTLAYTKAPIPQDLLALPSDSQERYYGLELEGTRVKSICRNPKEPGEHNFLMNIVICEREWLIREVEEACDKGSIFFEQDILSPKLMKLNMQGYCYEGYVARITSLKSYFDENMKMLEEQNLNALFSSGSIYTKIRDDSPTMYKSGSKAKNVMAADGCVVEGEVENSILSRGVRIKKNAKVKNCVIMQDALVEEGACLEYVIADKDVVVSAGCEVHGTGKNPVYLRKKTRV